MSLAAVALGYGMEKIVSATKEHKLGTLGATPDGRFFRYAFSGEAIGAGQLCMQKAGTALHDMDLTVAANAAINDTSITVDLGATAATLDQYEDGYIYINDADGEGHLHRIQSNPAADASAELEVTLEDGDVVREALVLDSSLAGLMENPYKDVEIYDANDVDGPPLGVAPTEVADDRYFWCQTMGFAAVLCDMASVLGQPVRAGDAIDGGFEPLDRDGTDENEPQIGIAALIAPVQSDYGVVYLTIGP